MGKASYTDRKLTECREICCTKILLFSFVFYMEEAFDTYDGVGGRTGDSIYTSYKKI